MNMNKTLPKAFVGVDVSKDFLAVYLHPVGKHFTVNNTERGLKSLMKKLLSYEIQQVVCESSGGYEHLLLDRVEKAGYRLWHVDPKRIKSFIESEGVKFKTDKNDAKMIALFASQKHATYERVILSDDQKALQELIDRKADLTKMLAAEKKRFHHPRHRRFKILIKKHIRFMEDQIRDIDDQVEELIEKNDELDAKSKIMESVPGIGKASASALLATMPELGTLGDKQAGALLGVAPYTHQSGQWIGKSFIRGGRIAARDAIYMASLTASRCNKKLSLFYRRLVAAGKKPKVALIAVMRKLIVIVNAMIKNDSE